ncbi:hypothetical protein [Bartonella florencae]|nr:hypothetical protein [Bartonella florencae]
MREGGAGGVWGTVLRGWGVLWEVVAAWLLCWGLVVCGAQF